MNIDEAALAGTAAGCVAGADVLLRFERLTGGFRFRFEQRFNGCSVGLRERSSGLASSAVVIVVDDDDDDDDVAVRWQ